MASGSLDFPISGKNSSGTYIQGRVEWSSAVISGQNQSTFSYTVKARKANDVYELDIPTGGGSDGAWTFSGSADGQSFSGSKNEGILTTFYTIGSGTKTITHGTDGKKTVAFSCTVTAPPGSGLSGLTSTGSGSFVLDTITPSARASTLSVSDGTLGSPQTITINAVSAGVTHTLYFDTGRHTETIPASGNIIQWTPAMSYASDSVNSRTFSCRFILDTYSGGSYIGEDVKTVTMTIPDTAATRPGIQISVSMQDGISIFGITYYVTGQSRARITSTFTGKYGATASIYSYTVGGSTTTGGASYTSNVLTAPGTLSVLATVTDSRGLRGSASWSGGTLYSYEAPKVVPVSGQSKIVCERCDQYGTPSDTGTYLLVRAKTQFSSVGGNNGARLNLKYKEHSASSYTDVSLISMAYSAQEFSGVVSGVTLSSLSSYDMKLIVTDGAGNTGEYTAGVGTESVPLHLADGGKRVAVGGYATAGNTNLFEVHWPTEFKDDVSVTGGLGVTGNASFAGDMGVQGAFSVKNKSLLDYVYPVGSIYMSVNSTSPQTLFGGTWAAISNRFLVASGSEYTAGTTGGNKNHSHTTGGHTLTVSEIPSHNHSVKGYVGATQWADGYIWGRATNNDGEGTHASNTTYTGGGGSHSHGDTGSASNLPPYLAVYMWKRTA